MKKRRREGILEIMPGGGLKRRRSGRPILQRILLCNDVSPEEYMQVPDIKSLVSIDPEEQLHITTSPKDIRSGGAVAHHNLAKRYHRSVDRYPDADWQRAARYDCFSAQSGKDHASENHRPGGAAESPGGDGVYFAGGRASRRSDRFPTQPGRGGLGANALEIPRRFFGAARNVEHGGSLTVLASILIHTGSRMDKVIYNEFKGTGNLDLVLSRECADQRMFPAININESGTRKEHKILSEEALDESYRLRRRIADLKPDSALQHVLRYFSQDQ